VSIFELRLVRPEEGPRVYQWHRGFVAANENLFPRTWDVYRQLAEDGQIWCACDESDNYVALSYFCQDGKEWEIGGLMVSTAQRGKGLAAIITRLTLGHLLFEEDPLDRSEPIIAHVHAENNDPRALMEHVLKFKFRKRVVIPGSTLPGLRVNAEGNVVGDEFIIAIPTSLLAVAEWCEQWNGSLKDGTPAQILLRPQTSLAQWARAFRQMALAPSPLPD
jgi:hypothetical protein